jgi:hypothetical protein
MMKPDCAAELKRRLTPTGMLLLTPRGGLEDGHDVVVCEE